MARPWVRRSCRLRQGVAHPGTGRGGAQLALPRADAPRDGPSLTPVSVLKTRRIRLVRADERDLVIEIGLIEVHGFLPVGKRKRGRSHSRRRLRVSKLAMV